MIIRLLVLLLLPIILFLIWRRFRRGEEETAGPVDYGLLGLAVVIVIGLGVMALSTGGQPGDEYVPPRVIDGEVVPGHIAPRQAQEPQAQPQPQDGGE